MAKRKRLTPARLPDGPVPEVASAPARAPLATPTRPPIADVAGDAASTAALRAVTAEMQAARDDGRLLQRLPLDTVDDTHLVRDRLVVNAEEMSVLKDSLRQKGQQTAIEVAALEGGGYGLISGWRRLTALRELQVENPEIDTVLAVVRQPADAAAAYEAMVAENEIRTNLSFYERARIVVGAVEAGVYRTDRLALTGLFGAVPRARRSKIRAFVQVVRRLDGLLHYPTGLTEKTGLHIAQIIDNDPPFLTALVDMLVKATPQDAADEKHSIERFLRQWPDRGAAKGERDQPRAERQQPKAEAPPAERLFRDVTLVSPRPGQIVLEGSALKDEAVLAQLKMALKSLE